MKIFCGLLLAFTWIFGCAQKSINVEGMTFEYVLLGNELQIKLSAPTLGWVGVGFNRENNIVGSDLLLFHVVEGEVEAKDMYVVSFGNPKLDTQIGGTANIQNMKGVEKNGYTEIQFSIPFVGTDQYDFEHALDKIFYLILAYSVDDDFAHHSRVRKHIPFMIKS